MTYIDQGTKAEACIFCTLYRLADRACRKYTLPLWCPDRYRSSARAPKSASLIISVFVRIVGLAVYSQAQFLADFEEGHFFSGDRNQRAAFRIAPLPRASVLDDKTAKAADLDTVALSQRFYHRIENCINNHFRVSPRQMRKSFVHLID